MAFLFKSKNKQGSNLPPASRNLSSSDGPHPNSNSTTTTAGFKDGAEKNSRFGTQAPAPANNTMIARGATPDQHGPHAPDMKQGPRNLANPAQQHHKQAHDLSLYPWSQRRIEFVSPQQSPFPRYGAAVNAVSSSKGDIYLMGGLINGSMVKGDLWIVEAHQSRLSCQPVATMAEGPGPRVGHASLLVGNAFIVFGGDTKIDEMDVLDDTLYLLNTSTKHWSRALPAGQRPAGRYGHTLNILGSRIYIFGGQVEGYFFNDLVAFDLNALQQASNRWEILIHNTNDGGPPQGQSPPARTNHSIVTWNDKLFLFGGTDGGRWFNDVWTYDPRTNSWTAQECIGFIPAAREGHAAALVGDVMYVFGGRTEEGKDLGDLAAFRIPTRRWYTFQNMGPSPSPRSGHGMTASGNLIYVLGGEPSSAPRDPGELSLTYVLDTSKIRYPSDQPAQQGLNGVKGPSSRRPSVTERSGTPQERSTSREGVYANGLSKWRNGSQDSMNETQPPAQKSMESAAPRDTLAQSYAPGRQTRGSPAPPPLGPPPVYSPPTIPAQQQATQPRMNGIGRPPFAAPDGRESPRMNQRLERTAVPDPSPYASGRASPATRDIPTRELQQQSSTLTQQYSPPRNPPEPDTLPSVTQPTNVSGAPPRKTSLSSPKGSTRSRRQQGSIDLDTPNEAFKTPMEQPERTLGLPGQFPADSSANSSPGGPNQQNDDLMKELESMRTTNAWYASELALARKAGYGGGTPEDSPSNEKALDAFADDEKPYIEALLKMRNEVLQVQEALTQRSDAAAEKIALVEKQRDAAIAEAVYARTRYAARMGKGRGLDESQDLSGPSNERSQEASRRLALALAQQNELNVKLRSLSSELEAERKARQLAEESADVAHGRASELDVHKQTSSSELERLRSELHEAQRSAREEATRGAEAYSSSKLLQVDKNELSGKLAVIQEESRNHLNVLGSLHEAVSSSSEKADLLERKLEHERRERESLEEKLAQLKSEHESRVVELETTSRRLQDAEDLAVSNASEARTHREAILAGFGRTRDRESDGFAAQDERGGILQQRLEEADAMVKRNQEAADHASERLRRAEERIAGLEAYQEQVSREGLSMRKQLQVASREALALHSEKAELQQQLTSEKMEATALQVQHGALKDLLHERGIDASSLPRTRTSDGSNQPSNERFRELEQQLEASVRAHEEMRGSFEQREHEANKVWEDKLGALDSDYQAAVKYLKGTEKMLSRMKQELHRYKSSNKDLEDELTKTRSERNSPSISQNWESERGALQMELDAMHMRVQQSTVQLESQMQDLHAAHAERDAVATQLGAARDQSQADLDSLRSHNATLEARATEAERRVQTLLETVGTTVNNYRRESMQPSGPMGHRNDASGSMHTHQPGHSRGRSDQSISGESAYSLPGDSGTGLHGHDGAADSDAGLSRNSVALDSLASELETLRTHWETTNKNYRSSGQSILERTPTSATAATSAPAEGFSENLATWRRKLELEERDDERGGVGEGVGRVGGAGLR